MKCCRNCFKDKEIIGFIYSNSSSKGKCDYCSSEDIELIDPRELEELFVPLVGIYQTTEELGIKIEDEKLLHQKLQLDWELFSLTEEADIDRLLKDILQGAISGDDKLFSQPVEISVIHRNGAAATEHELKWESFAEEIKSKNRFFLEETIDLNLLKELLRLLEKTYSKGKIFYRARISEKEALTIDELGKPPKEKSKPGRANPKGISYLYVSADQKTTEYESRCTYLDYISVGTFKLTETLSVISLRNTDEISPFVLESNIENYVMHQKYLSRLEKELSIPIRKFDKELDYLPTQYLCEYVKSLGYDAIEYGSALYPGGINLAIFNDDKIECKSVDFYEVDLMELHLSVIKV